MLHSQTEGHNLLLSFYLGIFVLAFSSKQPPDDLTAQLNMKHPINANNKYTEIMRAKNTKNIPQQQEEGCCYFLCLGK